MSYFFRNFVPDLGVLCFKEINRETKKTMDMKKTLLVLCALVASVSGFAADGDVFYAATREGVQMQFQVISESERTVQVYSTGSGNPAIEKTTEGKVTIPATVEYEGQLLEMPYLTIIPI